MGRLQGKVAIVTGAGSGIGRETADLFAAEGARVVVADLDEESAEATVAAIVAGGDQAIAVAADVSHAGDVARMVARSIAEWGRIDILHNNAGISMNPTPVEDITDDFFDRVIRVNLRSVFLGARAVVPHMKRQGGGVILNTGSASGIRPRPGASAYSASKGAVVALSKSLAVELGPFGIRVVSINPYSTDTPMLRTQIAESTPEQNAARVNAIPLGRLLTAADVARAALFLASDDAAMVTGTAFEIDGGRLV